MEQDSGKQSVNKVKSDQISFSSMDHEKIVEKLKKTNIEELTPEDAKFFLQELIKMI